MQRRAALLLRSAPLAAALALAACGGGEDANLAALDNELMANGADPALTSALEDQILVDPNLVQQSHPNSARPPETPVQAQYPSGGDPRVARASTDGGAPMPTSACGVPFDHGMHWARRLPAEFPAYPGGRVTEAAGANSGDCHVRVVTFTTPDRYNRVLEHYRSLAARSGFNAEHQVRGRDHVLGGVNEATDGAFYLIVTPGQGGSEAALIVNNGR
jgi:hypothetical protein